MATHTKTISLTDLQQKILSNDLYNDTDNAGLDDWIQTAVNGKINTRRSRSVVLIIVLRLRELIGFGWQI